MNHRRGVFSCFINQYLLIQLSQQDLPGLLSLLWVPSGLIGQLYRALPETERNQLLCCLPFVQDFVKIDSGFTFLTRSPAGPCGPGGPSSP